MIGLYRYNMVIRRRMGMFAYKGDLGTVEEPAVFAVTARIIQDYASLYTDLIVRKKCILTI